MKTILRDLLISGLVAGAALVGCQAANGKLNVIDTTCVTVTAVTGSGGASFGTIDVNAVVATVRDSPLCQDELICKFEYSLYIDRNGNGVEDPGEGQIGNSWEDPTGEGEKIVTVGGGTVTYGPGHGQLRYIAVVTFCNGVRTSSTGAVSTE